MVSNLSRLDWDIEFTCYYHYTGDDDDSLCSSYEGVLLFYFFSFRLGFLGSGSCLIHSLEVLGLVWFSSRCG